MPSLVATRTGLSTQACTIRSEASSVESSGMLSWIFVGAVIGVRTSGMLTVVNVTPWSANSIAAQLVHASSAALLAT